jgi:hypothetical protein
MGDRDQLESLQAKVNETVKSARAAAAEKPRPAQAAR